MLRPNQPSLVIPVVAKHDLGEQVKAEQLRMLFAHTTVGTLVATGFALALAAHVDGLIPLTEILIWLGIKLGIAAPRVLQGYWYRTRGQPYSRGWERWTILLLAVDGIWWGLGGAWLMGGPTELMAVITACLSSIASVATFGLQVRLIATAAYVVPMLVAPAAVALSRFDNVGILLGIGLLLFLGLLLSTARRSETRLAEVFRLRFLTDRISAERGDALLVAQHELRRVQEERALEQERARIAAMHEVVVARSAFLAKISHELRSPLQGIISALDVFEMRHGRGMAEDDELIGRMRRSSMLLNTQLRDLVTLAKGQAGRLELRPEPFDACALVEGVAAAARDAAKLKGIEVAITLPADTVFVVADGARIDQVLTNLVVNSIRYTEAGRVLIVLHPYDASQRGLRLTVSDTGPGIAPAMLPTLFAPDKLLTGTERRGEGSGIGLAIVGTLVDHMGGRVSVTSHEGQGTTFTLEIPAELVDPEATRRHAGESTRILVIDDRRDVLDALASVIDELGYECDRAESAAVGANLLAARAYDAVLFDIEMPFKSGAELAAETRRGNGPNRATRFLGMSATDTPPQPAGGPFDASLAKPIDRAALRAALLALRKA